MSARATRPGSMTQGRGSRLVTPLYAALASLALSASFCDETPQAGQGNLDRPGGVVAFTAGERSYALLPLPQVQHVRAFSLTSFIFVPAPNVYFPLSIPVGPFTQRVVVDEAHGLAFTLDSADGALRAIRLGVASDADAFKRVGEPIPAGLGPSGVAVDPTSDAPRLFVASALTGEVLEIEVAADVSEHRIVRVLPAGDKPADVAYAAAEDVLLVADAAAPEVSLIEVSSGVRRGVDVGGPTSRVVLAEAGLATDTPGETIALALRHDAPEIAFLRLSAGTPLYATCELPDLPVDATVLSSTRHGAEICAGIDDSGSCEYAAVMTVSGRLYYVDLAARDALGQPSPRVYDSEEASAAASGDPNLDEELYDPNEEDSAAGLRRPRVEVTTIEDFGAPPRVKQSEDVIYLFTYEGIVAPLRARRGRFDVTLNVFADTSIDVDVAAMGARVGDLVEVPPQAGCAQTLRLPILDLDGGRMQLAGATASLECLTQSGGVLYNVRAADQFTIAYAREDETPGIIGRARFGEPFAEKTVAITLWEAEEEDGTLRGPPATGAVLGVKIEDNFAPRALYLGGLSSLPTGVTSIQTSDTERAWRLLISAAGGSSLYVVEPGAQGSITDTGYLPMGVLRYE